MVSSVYDFNSEIHDSRYCGTERIQLRVETRRMCGSCFVASALSTPKASVFAVAGTQERLQGQLHESLEVIASLPSAVLREKT